jgi:hypothetical protein
MSDIYAEIRAERESHAAKGWTAEHDDEHGAVHLIDLADRYAYRYGRDDLVKAASLLVAAIEAMDRAREAREMSQREHDGYYQAARDQDGHIRLAGGVGSLVAMADDTYAEIRDWRDRATNPRFIRQYEAALELLDREWAEDY